MPDSALPEHLRGKKHWDWPWPFSLIPRGWTAFDWGYPFQMFGSQESDTEAGWPKPIGEPGSWQFSIYPDVPIWAVFFGWYFAITFKNGRHFRIGARWDDVDDYTQWPTIASRKYTGDPNEDTSTGPEKTA